LIECVINTSQHPVTAHHHWELKINWLLLVANWRCHIHCKKMT